MHFLKFNYYYEKNVVLKNNKYKKLLMIASIKTENQGWQTYGMCVQEGM